MSGRLDSVQPLRVVLEVHNEGNAEARNVLVEAELHGRPDRVQLTRPLSAGHRREVLLSFPGIEPTPGVHVVDLSLRYVDAIGRTSTQRAWLNLGFGPTLPSGVELSVPDATLDTALDLPIEVRATHGRARRVRVRVLAPAGVVAPDPPAEVTLEPGQPGTARVRLLRSGAPRPSTQGIVAVAEWDEGGVAGASVATSTIAIEPDPALLPRLRPYLVAAGLFLLLWAGWTEARRLPRQEA